MHTRGKGFTILLLREVSGKGIRHFTPTDPRISLTDEATASTPNAFPDASSTK